MVEREAIANERENVRTEGRGSLNFCEVADVDRVGQFSYHAL